MGIIRAIEFEKELYRNVETHCKETNQNFNLLINELLTKYLESNKISSK